MKSQRKPLNCGDIVKVYDGRLSDIVWYEVMSVSDEIVHVYAGSSGAVIHRNQVYKVKRKVKKKAIVFPAYSGKSDTTFGQEYLFRIRGADFSSLTKKQRKLYGVPEGVK